MQNTKSGANEKKNFVIWRTRWDQRIMILIFCIKTLSIRIGWLERSHPANGAFFIRSKMNMYSRSRNELITMHKLKTIGYFHFYVKHIFPLCLFLYLSFSPSCSFVDCQMSLALVACLLPFDLSWQMNNILNKGIEKSTICSKNGPKRFWAKQKKKKKEMKPTQQ